MNVLVLLNGEINDYAVIQQHLDHYPADIVCCVDGGYRHAHALSLTPDLLIGDMDSIREGDLSSSQDEGIETYQFPSAKDKSDFELALDHLAQSQARRVDVFGGGGGRVDHLLSNVMVMSRQTWTPNLALHLDGQIAFVLRGGQSATLRESIGTLVTLLPLSPVVGGVDALGFEYPLKNASLEFGSTRGLSNRVASEHSEISAASGQLLVVVGVGDET